MGVRSLDERLGSGHHQPTQVQATASRWRDCWSAEDEAMILLRYPERRMATIHLSFNQHPSFERHILFYDKALVEIVDVNTVILNGDSVHNSPSGEDTALLVTNSLFENQFAEFIAAIRGEPNRSALHPHGLALMRVIDATVAAALSGETVHMDWSKIEGAVEQHGRLAS